MSHNKLVLRSQTSNKEGINYETCLQIASCIDDTVIPSDHINLAWLILNIIKKKDTCEFMIIRYEMILMTKTPSILHLYSMKITFSHCAEYVSLTHVYLQTCSECVCTRKCSRSLEYSSDHSRQWTLSCGYHLNWPWISMLSHHKGKSLKPFVQEWP